MSSTILKRRLANVVLVCASVLISYVVMEAIYRLYLFESIRNQVVSRLVELGVKGGDDMHIFDPDIGYRRVPDKGWEHMGTYLRNRFRTNIYGQIANDIDPSPFPVEKPAGEYRIALLGDSFAAGDANYIRWVDLLQDYLNRSEDWRRQVGNKFTRVVNFAMGGTGLVQWGAVYEFEADRFAPDLVIVNFITDDIIRQFVFRGHHRFASEDELRDYVRERVTANMRTMPWFGWYPELLAATVGRLVAMPQRLTLAAAVTADAGTYFQSQDQAVFLSLASLERIRCLNPNLIVLHHRVLEEFRVREDNAERWANTPRLQDLLTKFGAAAQARGFSFVDLSETNPVPAPIDLLFNLPLDTHNSDYGQYVYASWVYAYLTDPRRGELGQKTMVGHGCR